MDTMNILFNDAGMGDAIARISTIKYIVNTYGLHVNCFIFDYFVPVLKHWLKSEGLDSKTSVYKWSEAKQHYNELIVTKSFQHFELKNLSMHMTDHAFIVTCNSIPSNKHLNYPKLDYKDIDISMFNLTPKRYVVVTTAFTAPVREFLPDHVNNITKWVKSKGYEVVFLGQKATHTGTAHVIEGKLSEDIDFTQGIDLIDKTILLQAGKILSEAKLVVGLDNGLIHLAACSDVPIVCGFTTVKPEHREPIRNNERGWDFFPVVPPETLECRFCQSNMVFEQHDFRYCIKDKNVIQCTKQLSADLYIKEMEKII